jgi:acylphosphatase
MVMFRDFTRRKARALGLVGEVENKEDGTVSVVAEGEKEKLEALVAHLKQGPLLARVDDVAVEWVEPSGAFGSFSIRYP